jgi:hypothetical protein
VRASGVPRVKEPSGSRGTSLEAAWGGAVWRPQIGSEHRGNPPMYIVENAPT